MNLIQEKVDKHMEKQKQTTSLQALVFKRVICNSGFLIGFLVLLSCLLVHSAYIHKIAIQEPVIEYRPSAMIYSLQGLFFGGYIQLFPLVACLPGFVLRKRSTLQMLNRKGKRLHIVVFFLAGALVCTLPYAVHTIICNIIAIPVNPVLYPEHEMDFWGIYSNLYSINGGIWMYLIIGLGMLICGGFYSLFFLVVSEYMHESYSAVIIPTIFYHTWLRFGVLAEESGIPLPPYLISNDALTVEDAIKTVVIYIVLSVVLVFIYQKKRSVR